MSKVEVLPEIFDSFISAKDVLEAEYPPVEYLIPGLIPEGATLLVASPKIGKSWFVLSLGMACARGGYALGVLKVAQRPVLYLALEDGESRLQKRMNSLNSGTGFTGAGLTFLTRLETCYTVADYISYFFHENYDRKPLAILDTLGRARKTYAGNDAYQNDYAEIAGLKRLADDCPGSSVLVVHHTNKRGGESGDFLGSVSGTQGLAGAADSILMIARERGGSNAKLQVTSRDAREGEYEIQLKETGDWVLVGNSLEEAAAAAREQDKTGSLGDTSRKILEYLEKYPEGAPVGNVAAAVGLDSKQASTYLRRLSEGDKVLYLRRGVYAPLGAEVVPLAG